MRTVVVHDWLTVPGGAERVLEHVLQVYPRSVIHTLIYDRQRFVDSAISKNVVRPSEIDRLPFSRSHHRYFLPIMPLAIEQIDLRAADLVISNAFAVSQGVLTRSDQLHIAYVNRTMAYAWDTYLQDLSAFRVDRPCLAALAKVGYHYLRQWDYLSFQRPDYIACNSVYTKRTLLKHYGRHATVIYPPVSAPAQSRRRPSDHYVFVGRLVPVKRLEVIVGAFNQLRHPLIVVGDGPLREPLQRSAGPNVKFLGWQPPSEVATIVASAKAFVFASEEAFGIAPVEAQMLGVPVIALSRGGTAETVVPGVNGILYDQPNVASLTTAISSFHDVAGRFDADRIVELANRFRPERFTGALRKFIDGSMEAFRADRADDE